VLVTDIHPIVHLVSVWLIAAHNGELLLF
jgi:hypothetical protein